MAELAPSGGGPNRTFLVLAIGLGGLLVLGLIGVGGFLLFQNASRATTSVATPTRLLATTTRVALVQPTAALAAATATDAPTNTPVFVATTPAPQTPGTPGATGTITGTVTPGTGTPGTGTPGTGSLPTTGVGEDLLLLAGGVVLVLIIFAARRARASAGA